jgi:hypothetical protein
MCLKTALTMIGNRDVKIKYREISMKVHVSILYIADMHVWSFPSLSIPPYLI